MTSSSEMAERRHAIVIGSSSGIGLAIARRLALDGFDLIMHGRDQDGAESALSELESLGAKAYWCSGDLRDPEVPAGLAELATNNFGKLEGLVNNAGAGIAKEFQDLSDADWEDQFNLHVRAPAALCRATSQLLKAARGAVVNISSLAAVLTVPKRVAYGAAKAGVEGLTRTLACEWAKDGVRVNAIAPGTIATPLVDKNLRAGTLDRDRVLERTPMGRFGTPQEIASVASFLLSDDAAYMTGQVLRVDGGWSVWGGWT